LPVLNLRKSTRRKDEKQGTNVGSYERSEMAHKPPNAAGREYNVKGQETTGRW